VKVYYGRRSRLSGRVLQAALQNLAGPSLNFGYQRAGQINPARAVALAAHKPRALRAMIAAGVPTPRLFSLDNAEFPCVGRPDKHRAGQGFYLCHNRHQAVAAARRGASHFLAFIEAGREFRVHVAFGQSIKLAEKIGGDPIIKNFSYGSRFMYPADFHHKQSLRRVAKAAVAALGLDFGAVDIIFKDGSFYVLEVNTAPSLTSQSDVLSRYVKAFKQNAERQT
jgi:D-alanine-D-alanine ligase